MTLVPPNAVRIWVLDDVRNVRHGVAGGFVTYFATTRLEDRQWKKETAQQQQDIRRLTLEVAISDPTFNVVRASLVHIVPTFVRPKAAV